MNGRKITTALTTALVVVFGASTATFEPSAILGQAHAEDAKVFHGVGVVTGLDAESGSITVDHGDIPGLMDAMEMQYRVQPSVLPHGLRKGDKIEFGVDGKTYTIVAIKKIASPRRRRDDSLRNPRRDQPLNVNSPVLGRAPSDRGLSGRTTNE
jgi:Cu/Ag efflux protein CusF